MGVENFKSWDGATYRAKDGSIKIKAVAARQGVTAAKLRAAFGAPPPEIAKYFHGGDNPNVRNPVGPQAPISATNPGQRYAIDDGHANDFIVPRIPAGTPVGAKKYGLMDMDHPSGPSTDRTVYRANADDEDRMRAELQQLYKQMDEYRGTPAFEGFANRATEIARNLENNTVAGGAVGFDPPLPFDPGPDNWWDALQEYGPMGALATGVGQVDRAIRRTGAPDAIDKVPGLSTLAQVGGHIGSADSGFGLGNANRPLPPNPNDYSELTSDGVRSGQDYQQKPMGNLRGSLQNQNSAVVQGPGGVLNNPGTLNTNGNRNPVTGAGTAAPGSGAAPLVPGSPLANGPHTGVNAGVSASGSPSTPSAGATPTQPSGLHPVSEGNGLVPLALAASGALGAGAQIYASNKEAEAADAAAKGQGKAAADSLSFQERMFNALMEREGAVYSQQREDTKPWREAGVNALNGLTNFDQNNPMPEVMGPFQFNTTGPNADPSYTFRFNEGRKALENSYASRGGLLGGNALRGITNYGQDAASQEYGNAFNRYMQQGTNRFNQQQINRGTKLGQLQSLAGVGQSAVQQLGQAGQNYASGSSNLGQNYMNSATNTMMTNANNQGSALTNAAAARTSGYGGAINSIMGAIGQGISYGQGQSDRELVNAILSRGR